MRRTVILAGLMVGCALMAAGDNVPNATGSVVAKITDTGGQLVNVMALGARGDGVSDDSAAIQAAINAAVGKGTVFFPPGTFRVTRNLYVYGTVDLVSNGSATIRLDADLAKADGVEYWINCGVPSKGGKPTTWTGRMRGLTFQVSANGNTQRILNIHRGYDWCVTQCTFDVTPGGARSVAGGICGMNNAAWCTPDTRQINRIMHCKFLGAQAAATGSEAISMGNASQVWIEGNYTYGFGDDAIAVHLCTDVVITNNRCYSADGRIYADGLVHGQIHDNFIQRIQDVATNTWIAGGGLIWIEISAAVSPAPTDIAITNNWLQHGLGTGRNTYGIRLRGVRNTTVTDNSIRDDSGLGYGITLEGMVGPNGWTDPAGLDKDGKARLRNVRIHGNQLGGTTPPRIFEGQAFPGSTAGPVIVYGNTPSRIAAGSSTYTVGEDFETNGNIVIRDGSWNGSHLVMGKNHLWIDSTGTLRIKPASPTSDTDGVAIQPASTPGKAAGARSRRK